MRHWSSCSLLTQSNTVLHTERQRRRPTLIPDSHSILSIHIILKCPQSLYKVSGLVILFRLVSGEGKDIGTDWSLFGFILTVPA